MADEKRADEPRSELDKGKGKVVGSSGALPTIKSSPASDPDLPVAEDPQAPKKLTPEEQMALFEKELKENDWGHQPC
jgi:hypothetical protein